MGLKYTEQILFKIGVVRENVDEILDHSVAEVVLLLKGRGIEKR